MNEINTTGPIYFLYSEKQRKENTERANTIGLEYNIGKILHRGKALEYTECRVKDLGDIEVIFPDVKIVSKLDTIVGVRLEEPYIG